jgi:hypothetical protein
MNNFMSLLVLSSKKDSVLCGTMVTKTNLTTKEFTLLS